MRKSLRWSLLPLGLGLFLTAFITQEGTALSRQSQETTPTFIPSERLAQPTLPAEPSQADQGAVDYWLNCMVCHGDQGQGLTDEFRMLYPPEEQTCWQSGCHGNRPYADGFTLPTAIPPVTGPEAPLHNFKDASVLYAFISTAMPWHKPASLQPEVYWRLTAYLLRENGYQNPYEELGPENAAFIPIGGENAEVGTEEVALATTHPTQIAQDELIEPDRGHLVDAKGSIMLSAAVLITVLIVGGAVVLLRKSKKRNSSSKK
jgi:cytochrome c